MATGVTPYGTTTSAFTQGPPPPPIRAGGNRSNKHVVGGANSNVAYTPGTNLMNARSAYQTNQDQGGGQNALQRGFFQGQNEVAPDFSQVSTNAMQQGQGLAQGQAIGNTLFQHTLGNLRSPNAPTGLGFGRSNTLGVVRQHTVTGNEAMDSGMSYTATPAPNPPPPPAPASVTPAIVPGSTGINPVTGVQMPALPPPKVVDAVTQKTQYELAPLRITVGPKAVVGGKLSDGSIYAGRAAVKGTSPQQYAPLIKVSNGKGGFTTVPHPSWAAWMRAAGVSI